MTENKLRGTWEKIDDVSKNIAAEPWSLYWKEHKSGTVEFTSLLQNPISQLKGALDAVDDDWRVQSHFIGHEIGMEINAHCTLALVDPLSKTVFLTFYKHPKE